jgi:hypothetical protein
MAAPKKKAKNKGPTAARSAKAPMAPRLTPDLKAEQARESEEFHRAQNAQASIRDRMVKIGRGNQQSGRQ